MRYAAGVDSGMAALWEGATPINLTPTIDVRFCACVLQQIGCGGREKFLATGLGEKAKRLVETVGENPFVNPPAHEALRGNLVIYRRSSAL